MNPNNESPTLRTILKSVINRENFHSKYVSEEDKNYFLNNFDTINIFKGNFHEVCFITKK